MITQLNSKSHGPVPVISTCRIVHAAKKIHANGDKGPANQLKEDLKKYLDAGFTTVMPCGHQPQCRCQDVVLMKLVEVVPELIKLFPKQNG